MDKFAEMKMNLSRMRDEKRGTTTPTKEAKEPPKSPKPETGEKKVMMSEPVKKDKEKSTKKKDKDKTESSGGDSRAGRSTERDSKPGKRQKRSSSVQKWNELKSRTEMMRNTSTQRSGKITRNVKPAAEGEDSPSTVKFGGTEEGDTKTRMAAGKAQFEEMRKRTEARRKRKEELKRQREEKKVALDGKMQNFLGMLSNIETMIQTFDKEKQKLSLQIKALESENQTLKRKLIDKKSNKNLTDAREGLGKLVADASLSGGAIEQIKSIKLLVDAFMGDFQAEVKVGELVERERRMSIAPPPPPPFAADGKAPPPPPPPSSSSLVSLPVSTSGGSSGGGRNSLLSAIRAGTSLKKLDMQQVQKEKEESGGDDIYSQLADTMKMALGIRRAVMETQESDDDDSDDDEWFDD